MTASIIHIRPRITVESVDLALEQAVDWVGDDPDRLALFGAFVDLVRACQAAQIARATLRRTEAELRAIDAEYAAVRAELAALRGANDGTD